MSDITDITRDQVARGVDQRLCLAARTLHLFRKRQKANCIAFKGAFIAKVHNNQRRANQAETLSRRYGIKFCRLLQSSLNFNILKLLRSSLRPIRCLNPSRFDRYVRSVSELDVRLPQ